MDPSVPNRPVLGESQQVGHSDQDAGRRADQNAPELVQNPNQGMNSVSRELESTTDTSEIPPTDSNIDAFHIAIQAPAASSGSRSPYGECLQPVTITVKNFTYAIPTKEYLPGCTLKYSTMKNKGDLSRKKLLLDSVSMIAYPGELLAIIGPSGGGKTTLLNALAMRAPDWCIPSGEIKFNGQMETKETVKATMNYVMAHDKLLPYLTVFETLASAADLKLAHLPKEERRARVECVLTDMCLEKCRDTYIGGEWRQGVSTGEMKRVAIGIELLDQPSVLVLDEPTSGLDASLSVKLVELLLKEARKGRTVITTVHQPSSQIFEMFDRFLLLSHGEVAYYGPREGALPYFSQLGHTAYKDWNHSDFLLDLVSDHATTTAADCGEGELPDLAAHSCNSVRRLALLDQWKASDQQQELMRVIDEVATSSIPQKQEGVPKTKSRRQKCWRWGHEVATLWKRQSRNSIRNPITAIITLLIQAMQGLIIGGIFLHLPTVGPGGKPPPLLYRDFWENPFVVAYNWGVVEKDNHPLVDIFTQGADKNGSYILGNATTKDEEWQGRIHWFLDDVVTKLYNEPALGMAGGKGFEYPELVEMKSRASGSWEKWTPRRIYTNIMAAYQIFDREWPNDKHHPTIDWTFFNKCYAEQMTGGSNVMGFFLCVMQKGKKSFDPVVTSVGFRALPAMDRRLGEEQEGATINEGHRTGRNRRMGETAAENSKMVNDREKEKYAFIYSRLHDQLDTQSVQAKERRLAGFGGMGEKDFVGMVGDNLMQIIDAANEWVRRMTTCEGPICDKMKSIHDLVSTWTASTVETMSSALNLSGCLFFVTSILGFASYDALLTFPQDRALFNRETINGLYQPSSYYVAKNIADLPFQLIPCLVMATIFYFLVGFDVTARQYLLYFVICALTTFSAYGFGYMISAGSPRMEVAIVVAPLTLVVWLVLAGFFLRDGDFPAWINWFKYLSFYRWSFFALVTNQFTPGKYFGTLPNSLHLALSGVTMTNLSFSLLWLGLLGLSYRVIGFVLLATTNRRVGLEA